MYYPETRLVAYPSNFRGHTKYSFLIKCAETAYYKKISMGFLGMYKICAFAVSNGLVVIAQDLPICYNV